MITEKPLYSLLRLLFGGKSANMSVATQVHIDAAPEMVWRGILFYEEVSDEPPLLLRALIPRPVRTRGDKTVVGARVMCSYKGGNLVKLITALEPPNLIQFEVIEQHLGIESCVAAQNGSYKICSSGAGANVVLTTNYRTYLRPRWLWGRMERLAVHQLHTHILNGMRKAIAPLTAALFGIVAEPGISKNLSGEEIACTASHSPSHR